MKLINLARIDFGGVATGGKAKPEETFDVQPTTSDQTITPSEGSVFSGGTVRAVTSSIDVNIVSNNIKEGVTILGVAGTLKGEKPEESFNVQPTTSEQIITPTEGSVFSGGTVHAVTSAIDSNIKSINIKKGVSILGVKGTLSASSVFTIFEGMRFGKSDITEVPSNFDFSRFGSITNSSYMFQDCRRLTKIPSIDTSNVQFMDSMFQNCIKLTTIPSIDTSSAKSMDSMFYGCVSLTSVPPLNTFNVYNMNYLFNNCNNLTTVEGIDFSGFTREVSYLFGYTNMSKLTRFIVNGKINASISDNYSISKLTAIDYDSVKSILAAADRTDNTNAKELAFDRTMTDQNGELAALVASCTSKGWTITGLTLQ